MKKVKEYLWLAFAITVSTIIVLAGAYSGGSMPFLN